MLDVNVIGTEPKRSEYWLVPDILFAAMILVLWGIGRWFVLGILDDQVSESIRQAARIQSSIQSLEETIATKGDLSQQLGALEERQRVLQSLNEQQVIRYRPIILMELLQAAKPESLWFESIDFLQAASRSNESGDWPKGLRVIGRAVDQAQIAAFIAKLADTSSSPVRKEDPRTQLYFEDLRLVNLVRREGIESAGDDGISLGPDVAPFYQFIIEFQFYERAT